MLYIMGKIFAKSRKETKTPATMDHKEELRVENEIEREPISAMSFIDGSLYCGDQAGVRIAGQANFVSVRISLIVFCMLSTSYIPVDPPLMKLLMKVIKIRFLSSIFKVNK